MMMKVTWVAVGDLQKSGIFEVNSKSVMDTDQENPKGVGFAGIKYVVGINMNVDRAWVHLPREESGVWGSQ
jgi:hypothetical protein